MRRRRRREIPASLPSNSMPMTGENRAPSSMSSPARLSIPAAITVEAAVVRGGRRGPRSGASARRPPKEAIECARRHRTVFRQGRARASREREHRNLREASSDSTERQALIDQNDRARRKREQASLGANALQRLSCAVAKAAADECRCRLYRYLGGGGESSLGAIMNGSTAARMRTQDRLQESCSCRSGAFVARR